MRLRWTDRVDLWALHPVIGYAVLFLILFAVFQTLFTLASYPMEWLDSLFGAIASYLQTFENPKWFIEFLAEAVIPGIGGVLIFIPQIALLFLLNTFLEESGYMARIVFLLDRFMRRFGLSGKSILPLLSGNACAIPAMASTKAIPTHKERLITILTIPFMTCSARLPVYALLISITIPLKFQGATLLGLYLLGGIFALLFAWILDKNIQTKEKSFLIMELPPYRLPSFRNVVTNIKNAVIPFVMTAGKFIISISIILWLLGSFHFENRQLERTHIENSFLSQIGKSIEPAIRPLGYDWKIGIALLSSFAAREVFVSTLATLYQIDSENEGTIFEKIKNQKNATTQEPIYTTAVGVSLLLFYAFALQCMSTLAAMKKETGSWKYPLFSFFTMLTLAYACAFFLQSNKMKLKFKLILGCYLISICNWPIYSQSKTVDTVIINNVLLKNSLSRIARTKSDIEHTSSYTLLDELSKLPSVNIQSRGFLGSQADISIRGSTYEQVAILFNGIRINHPQTGHNNMMLPIPLEFIDQIEVIQNGNAKHYGANAFAGAIELNTIKPKKHN